MRKFGTNYGEMGLGKIMKNCAGFDKIRKWENKILTFSWFTSKKSRALLAYTPIFCCRSYL
jgi:hypothetical protein